MILIEPRIEILGTLLFAAAIVHTFSVKIFLKWAHRYPEGSTGEALFHLLGELEVVFAIWSFAFLLIWFLIDGASPVVSYLESVRFTEPLFVFCVMVMASTKPMVTLAKEVILKLSSGLSQIFRINRVQMDLLVVLAVGPLAGSLVTEPAAMTVSALLLFSILHHAPAKLVYGALAVLFVNISIGGSLSHFAAPPILMVAGNWNWDLNFVFSHFGWKSALAVFANSLILVFIHRSSIKQSCRALGESEKEKLIPGWVLVSHLIVLVFLVIASHQSVVFLGVFIFFLGIVSITKKYQQPLRLKESLLVAIFLTGIILFGVFQKWWLQPLLERMGETSLYFVSVALTSVTDNAALTYLGSQVSGLSEASRYYLVAGAIAGGGLTVIANAPNAAGLSILQSKLKDGFDPIALFVAALWPTAIAVLALEFLPHL